MQRVYGRKDFSYVATKYRPAGKYDDGHLWAVWRRRLPETNTGLPAV